ncbi:MAG TPA: hypothetical protein VKK79_10815 [Candidatus Lokiarchaeia archaeon]|nr:hypothetical protein [Candidatus Lokiarchaeia archaeon]
MFEARLDNGHQQCAFAGTVAEAAEALRSLSPSAGDIYVYEYQSQQLVKVLKHR